MEPLDFVVHAGRHDRHACPVWVQVPPPSSGPIATYQIVDGEGADVPCQAETSGITADDRVLISFLVRGLAAGEKRQYRLLAGPPVVPLPVIASDDVPSAPEFVDQDPSTRTGTVAEVDAVGAAREAVLPEADRAGDVVTDGADLGSPPAPHRDPVAGVYLEELDGQLVIEIDGSVVTTYHFGSDVTRPFFHPLVGPTGESVVRGFPVLDGVADETSDHPHHRGLWIAHGDVNGHDNWLEGSGKATVRHTGFPRLVSGQVYGAFDATSEWIDRWGSVALTDTRRLTVFNVGPDERLLELSVRFNASHGQITFGDTKEAGIVAIRVASSMDGPTTHNPDGRGQIETSDGSRGEGEAWGRRAVWCDFSGPIAGEVVGVGVLDHPTNPRFPTHWHVRDYGLMTVNPFGLHDFYGDSDAHRGDFIIPPYESRVFRYRIVVHRGDAQTGKIIDRYHDFVNPPVVELL